MDIKQVLCNIYATLESVEIKSSKSNVQMMYGVFTELEKIIGDIELKQNQNVEDNHS